MTYNVFGGTLSLTQSINQSLTALFSDGVWLVQMVQPVCRCMVYVDRAPVLTSCSVDDLC